MYRAEFELETITPLFMRGADQSKAEFRSASVKGVMRWWFRALAGSYFGNNIKNLQKAECRVFGCAGQGGTRRSPVVIKTEFVGSERGYSTNGNRYESYFWFSQVGRYAKSAILPGTRLSLALESHDENSLKVAVLSLWAALHLGGFGSRSRKFAGSLFPVSEPCLDVDTGVSFIPSGNVEDFYREILEKKKLFSEFSAALRELKFRPGNPYPGTPEYPVLDEKHSIVAIGNAKRSVHEAIEQVGRWYLGNPGGKGKFSGGFRFKYADRKLPSRIYSLYTEPNNKRHVFALSERRPFLGLPIPFYKSLRGGYIRFTVDHWNATRRASGLIFTVNAIRSGSAVSYYPVVTLLSYRFLPNYQGSVKYGGLIVVDGNKKRIGGPIIMITGQTDSERAQNSEREYNRYLGLLASSISGSLTRVFGSLEVFQ